MLAGLFTAKVWETCLSVSVPGVYLMAFYLTAREFLQLSKEQQLDQYQKYEKFILRAYEWRIEQATDWDPSRFVGIPGIVAVFLRWYGWINDKQRDAIYDDSSIDPMEIVYELIEAGKINAMRREELALEIVKDFYTNGGRNALEELAETCSDNSDEKLLSTLDENYREVRKLMGNIFV